MFRSIIRDIIFLYIAYKLLRVVVFSESLAGTEYILFALAIIIFTIWFWLEKFGILPKLG